MSGLDGGLDRIVRSPFGLLYDRAATWPNPTMMLGLLNPDTEINSACVALSHVTCSRVQNRRRCCSRAEGYSISTCSWSPCTAGSARGDRRSTPDVREAGTVTPITRSACWRPAGRTLGRGPSRASTRPNARNPSSSISSDYRWWQLRHMTTPHEH
jgi:hypothetical protein